MSRVFELTLCFLLLPLFCVFYLLLYLPLRSFTRSSPLFFHQRAGKYMIPFRLIKFRTIPVFSASLKSSFLGVTTFNSGHPLLLFLRNSRIDEIPQLFNLATGDISLIGYRPDTLKSLSCIRDSHPTLFNRIIQLKPGLVSPVSLLFRNEAHLISLASDHFNLEPDLIYRYYVNPLKLRLALRYHFYSSASPALAFVYIVSSLSPFLSSFFGFRPLRPDFLIKRIESRPLLGSEL